MNKFLLLAIALAISLCGCASNKKQPQAKKIYERPWIGGHFERVSTPAAVKTNAQHFAGHGVLITRVREQTPLAAAGLQEGDLLLAINGKNIRSETDLQAAIDHAASGPLTFTVFRHGEISEKPVTPGIERFEKAHHVIIAIGLSANLNFDLYPNPDFSLVALGFDSKGERLDLRDAAAKYRTEELHQNEPANNEGWQGLASNEGWKAWLGPFAYSENKMIISQESSRRVSDSR
jgi:membrane-associated protease RseP (regulator of RpoE activity)